MLVFVLVFDIELRPYVGQNMRKWEQNVACYAHAEKKKKRSEGTTGVDEAYVSVLITKIGSRCKKSVGGIGRKFPKLSQGTQTISLSDGFQTLIKNTDKCVVRVLRNSFDRSIIRFIRSICHD